MVRSLSYLIPSDHFGITPQGRCGQGSVSGTISDTGSETWHDYHTEGGRMEQSASFGYWLRRRRKAMDLTQAGLAERAGYAETTIRKIEADARRPSREMAERLADLLELSDEERVAFLKTA